MPGGSIQIDQEPGVFPLKNRGVQKIAQVGGNLGGAGIPDLVAVAAVAEGGKPLFLRARDGGRGMLASDEELELGKHSL